MAVWSIFFASDKISFTENAPLSFVYRFYICFFKYSKSEGKKQSKKAYKKGIYKGKRATGEVALCKGEGMYTMFIHYPLL